MLDNRRKKNLRSLLLSTKWSKRNYQKS